MTELDIDTGTLLTITTGLFLTESFDRFHEAVEVLMGQPIFTHQLASARLADDLAREAQRQHPWTADPCLLDDYPMLDGLDKADTAAAVRRWVAEVSARHGSTHRITSAPETRGVSFTEGLPAKFGGTG